MNYPDLSIAFKKVYIAICNNWYLTLRKRLYEMRTYHKRRDFETLTIGQKLFCSFSSAAILFLFYSVISVCKTSTLHLTLSEAAYFDGIDSINLLSTLNLLIYVWYHYK